MANQEKIISIEEGTFNIGDSTNYSLWDVFEGYSIITDKQTVRVGINVWQQCFEVFGYLTSEDDISSFEGADLLGIHVTDAALKTYDFSSILGGNCEGEYAPSAMFINFETSIGTLQFVAYNKHNGYYSHKVYLSSEQLSVCSEV